MEHQREIKIPHKVMERQTVMVPKQRVVMYEEEASFISLSPNQIQNCTNLQFDILTIAATPCATNCNYGPELLSVFYSGCKQSVLHGIFNSVPNLAKLKLTWPERSISCSYPTSAHLKAVSPTVAIGVLILQEECFVYKIRSAEKA